MGRKQIWFYYQFDSTFGTIEVRARSLDDAFAWLLKALPGYEFSNAVLVTDKQQLIHKPGTGQKV